MTVEFRPGRLPAHPEETHPRLKLAPFVVGAPVPPPSVDWYSRVTQWPMYGNDRIGDCTEAMVGHLIENASTYGEGQTIVISEDAVIKAYSRVSGYDPATGANDNGAVLQDVFNDYRKNGVGGHHNLVFAQVGLGGGDVKDAIHLFGAVGLGIVVTQSMMDAFNHGQPWVSASGPQLGGHAVPAVGYDADGVYVVTWGRVQLMTWSCFSQCVEEAWVAVLPEWFSAAGQDPEGVDLHGLGEEFAALTGGPNPFPAPAPQPTPTPAPVPVPPPAPGPLDGPARALAAAVPRRWVESHHHHGDARLAADAVREFLASTGL